MGGYRKILIWILIIAIFSVLLLFVRIFYYETKANKNVNNCQKVKDEMSMSQVIDIMGKPDGVDTYNTRINYKDIDVIRYYYDAPSGSSSGVDIYFEAESLKVIRIVCKE